MRGWAAVLGPWLQSHAGATCHQELKRGISMPAGTGLGRRPDAATFTQLKNTSLSPVKVVG